jgi:hypothetical protein
VELLGRLLAAFYRSREIGAAVVVAVYLALGLRALLLLFLDRRAHPVSTLGRLLGVGLYGAGFWLFALFTRPWLSWDSGTLAGGLAGFLSILGTLALGRSERRFPWRAALFHGALLVLLVTASVVSLLFANFLPLAQDRLVLLVDITGETGTKFVRWSAPDGPPRAEALPTHRVVFRTPEGDPVAEAWVYGDEVAVKGQVLRLQPWLNALGLPNLFELLFAHNGYGTAERHQAYPPQAVELPPQGPLAVHPLWRPLQRRLMDALEHGKSPESVWAVKAVSTESTFFPLVDRDGEATKAVYRLVVTPGGLTTGANP